MYEGDLRAFFLSAEAPYPAVGGGAMRSASLLEFLTQRYTVDVALFNEEQSADPRLNFPAGVARKVSVINLPYHSKSTTARYGRAAWRGVRNRPPLIDRFSGFERQVAEAVGGERYDLAVIEHIWCAPYVKQIRPHARLVVLDAHNIESVWHERVARTGGAMQGVVFKRFASACRRFERKWLPQFDAVLVTSEEDARHTAGARAVVYPNAMPLVARPERVEEHAIMFTGNLEYQPNIAAVEYFHKKIWPLLRERVPELVWRIAGKNPGGDRARDQRRSAGTRHRSYGRCYGDAGDGEDRGGAAAVRKRDALQDCGGVGGGNAGDFDEYGGGRIAVHGRGTPADMRGTGGICGSGGIFARSTRSTRATGGSRTTSL